MGIPNFLRFISERYPLVSQLMERDKIPEFDNLYLDVNDIIHQCSRPSDISSFWVSEEQIFSSILLFIDYLFRKINPRKLFFLAVDGVAPRAKMNQQRSRRFCTAKEAQRLKEKAEMGDRKLPEENVFDSNCITPGTTFMARLSERLQYYLNRKITEDVNWRKIKVILSGPEVPGEGEHKIIQYIRLSRALPGYDPNTRHCLFGSDSDLIILGLSSHEPHFCLLREDTAALRPSSKRLGATILDSMNFHFVHLSLMREYIDIEFRDLAPRLSFEYSLENVIDDFILLSVFVGNDYLPYLPGFHIKENGLEKLFDIYKRILPTLDGYLNMSGIIPLGRFQVLLNEMAQLDQETSEREHALSNSLNRKPWDGVEAIFGRSQAVMTKSERAIWNAVKAFLANPDRSLSSTLSMENTFSAREHAFITKLAQDLNLVVRWDEFDGDGNNLVTWTLPEVPEDNGIDAEGSHESDHEGNGSNIDATMYALSKYEYPPTMPPAVVQEENSDGEKLEKWKRRYYEENFDLSYGKTKEVARVVHRYIEGIQWVMRSYYGSVPSWTWFYNYRYAPLATDLRGVDKMTFDFTIGEPFTPFEQLMAVLPPASSEHVPRAYRDLMTGPNSPIIDFYPIHFDSACGIREATVKLPFIDEARLLRAMKPCEHRLTPEERKRNISATPMKLSYTSDESTFSPSPIPTILPPISRCRCKMDPLVPPFSDDIRPPPGLCDGVHLGASAPPGIPSLHTLSNSAALGDYGVDIYPLESAYRTTSGKSVIIKIGNTFEGFSAHEIAERFIGERILAGWPYLWEALVTGVSDSVFIYDRPLSTRARPSTVLSIRHSIQGSREWKSKAELLERIYMDRHRMLVGPVNVLLHVRPLVGITVSDMGDVVKEYVSEKDAVDYPVQTCLKIVKSQDSCATETGPLSLDDLFPTNTQVFFLGNSLYGTLGMVQATHGDSLSILIEYTPSETAEIERLKSFVTGSQMKPRYRPSYDVANTLQISTLALSKITSRFLVSTSGDGRKINIGLGMKFDAKRLKVVGYTRKNGRHWEFSDEAVILMEAYKTYFPEVFECLDTVDDLIPLAVDIFRGADPDKRSQEARRWLEERGISSFKPVPLQCEQFPQAYMGELEQVLSSIGKASSDPITQQMVINKYPSPVILRPEHATNILKNQIFAVGDRVRMVSGSSSVPLGAKGVIIGHDKDIVDVLWDEPFILGTTLDGRCSDYRGTTLDPKLCLNLTNPQFMVSMNTEPVSSAGGHSNRYIPPHLRASQQATVTSNTHSRSQSSQRTILESSNRHVPSHRPMPKPASVSSNRYKPPHQRSTQP